MSEKKGDEIRVNISGNISGQVAVGKHISQIENTGLIQPDITEDELMVLKQLLENLKAKVASEASPDKKDSALERVQELQEAVTAKEPDLTTMEYVRKWFSKHLPKLSGAVTGVVIHPIVGKLVEAAGNTLADDFRRRFS